MSSSNLQSVAPALVAWHATHGRHDLPWQQQRSAYRVWISEIMLQQTQVAKVIPYYQRFMQQFPDVARLAQAPIDAVLHLWTGLGYYARARNLHRAAQCIYKEFSGEFPLDFDSVVALPGIGRSTAGAILALSADLRHPILDGNVKRVLARYCGLTGDLSTATQIAELWRLAELTTPAAQVATYTQAIMDLGATVCTRRKPLCQQCPLNSECNAYLTGRQHEIPAPKRARVRGLRHVFMLVAQTDDHRVLLEQRPAQGIWGGLWSFPEFATQQALQDYLQQQSPLVAANMETLSAIQHTFTHFDLHAIPIRARYTTSESVQELQTSFWYDLKNPPALGLPAPVKALLAELAQPTLFSHSL
jgi:A/G-specific adenine glycosylase